jgi:hypothetical protein
MANEIKEYSSSLKKELHKLQVELPDKFEDIFIKNVYRIGISNYVELGSWIMIECLEKKKKEEYIDEQTLLRIIDNIRHRIARRMRHEGPQKILTNEEIDTRTNIEETALLRHRFSIFLKNLSYDEIRIFEYFFIEEEKDKEKIIKELEISQATFYRRLERIKQKFRHFIANNSII